MLAAMLMIVKIASTLPATKPNSRSATVSVSRPSGSTGQVGDRHRVEVEDVQREIDRDHGERAERERPRQVAIRIANLLGDVRRRRSSPSS